MNIDELKDGIPIVLRNNCGVQKAWVRLQVYWNPFEDMFYATNAKDAKTIKKQYEAGIGHGLPDFGCSCYEQYINLSTGDPRSCITLK